MSSLSAAVNDQIPVGTPAILDSPHVSEGPGRIAKAPVPSIYQDDRGDIHRLRVGGMRINLLYSQRGVMRSGYLHPHIMRDTIISGQVEVWTLTDAGTVKTVYKEQESFQIDPYVPHILYFLEDSIIAEWWDAPHFQCFYYHPYRKIIDVQNSLVAKEHAATDHQHAHAHHHPNIGRHQRLVPQDEAPLASGCSPLSTILVAVAGVTIGAIAGFVVGVALGEAKMSRDYPSLGGGSSSRQT